MSAKALNEDTGADSGGWSWSTGGVHPRIGVVPSFVLSAGCLSLLLAMGIAVAQTAPTATPVKPRIVKQLPPSASQVQPGMVKELPPGVFQVTPGMVKQIPPDVSQVDPGRLTEVPDLKGHRQEELPPILERRFLYLGAVASAYSNDPVGVVTAQDPVAGQTVFRGRSVDVTISRGPDTVGVPDVTTHPLSVAKQMLARADLTVGNIAGIESEASVETVLDQRPSWGAKVSRGSSVDLTIAVAVKKVPVPSLTTLTEEVSRQLLTDAGLTEGGREEQNADEPAGTIIGQDPVAGTMVSPGTPISRVVSAGPRAATVPDLRERSISEASNLLREAGLRLGRQQEQESDGPPGRVLQQEPASGTQTPNGTPVNVTLSKSRTATVPDLTGLGSDEARRTLAQSGLALAAVRDEPSDQPAGTVLRQDPGAGSSVQPGTAVAVWIAVAPTKVPLWVLGTILGATFLGVEGYRRVAKNRKRQREDRDKPMPGLEIRAVQDEGKQRLSRSPASVESIGLVVHSDDGRQRVRLPHDGSSEEDEIDE